MIPQLRSVTGVMLLAVIMIGTLGHSAQAQVTLGTDFTYQGRLKDGDTPMEGTVNLLFKLYDTYGLPIELTAEIAAGRGLSVDMEGFENEMEAQREKARAAHRFELGDRTHIEKVIGEQFRSSIVVRRIFSHRDFISDYNAYGGTALGLAHTLNQTAFFRPAFRSKKVENLYYAGQYTHPGVGVPMVLIAAQVAAGLISGECA